MAHHVVVVGIYRSRCRAKNSIHKNQHIVQTVVGVAAATIVVVLVVAAVVEKDNVGRERVKNISSAALNGGVSSVQGPPASLCMCSKLSQRDISLTRLLSVFYLALSLSLTLPLLVSLSCSLS